MAERPKEETVGADADEKKKKKKPGKNGGNGTREKKEGAGKSEPPVPPPEQQREWTSDLQADYDRILSVGEECVSPGELRSLLLVKGRGSQGGGFRLYDGFEPSGRMHVAQGIFKAMNVNKCTSAGTNSTFVFWVADWFALMNDKMGGDLDKIKTVGRYLVEVWKAAGMDLSSVEFKWASEEITKNADSYWPIVLDVARSFNVTRIKKCCQIMGRTEGTLTAAQILYPLMQCADVFFLRADVCQLGVDQRKVNMLAREYCDANKKLKKKKSKKPVVLSHHMLYGLKRGQEKMSKSDPDSAIFMEDSAEDVERKIAAAYCPDKEEEEEETEGDSNNNQEAGKESMHLVVDKLKNPCLDYVEHIVLSPPDSTFSVGDETYSDFDSVKAAFLSGAITETQLKRGLVTALNDLLEPVRKHFAEDDTARDLLERVRSFKREAAATDAEPRARRPNWPEAKLVPPDSRVVFAPLPAARPTLQSAIDVLTLLRRDRDEGQRGSGPPKVLFLSDWTAFVRNSCDGDETARNAHDAVFLSALNSLDPVLMSSVTVVKQSELILSDPSNYWITAIDVGRTFSLDDVMGTDVIDSDGAGKVVGRLMRVADVVGLNPSEARFLSSSRDGSAVDPAAEAERSLTERFYEKAPMGDGRCSGGKKPTLSAGAEGPSLALQKEKSEEHKTKNDEYYLLDDPKVHGKSKMKKAFCEPGNVDFCPPIALLSALALDDACAPSSTAAANEIVIRRSQENGGDVAYPSKRRLEEDFASGSLHPGDLKAASSKLAVDILETIAEGIRSDPEVAKAAKALGAFEKRSSKQKKKGKGGGGGGGGGGGKKK